MSERRASRVTEGDPYKKVWNSVDDEEASILESMRNGTLFTPTMADLSRRHMGRAKFLLKKARQLGRTAEGREVFADALFHKNLAQDLLNQHLEVLAKSKPQTMIWAVDVAEKSGDIEDAA